MGVSQTISLGWPQPAILLISVFQVARIIGVNHWCPAKKAFLMGINQGLGELFGPVPLVHVVGPKECLHSLRQTVSGLVNRKKICTNLLMYTSSWEPHKI
jgi:hypothetical protein